MEKRTPTIRTPVIIFPMMQFHDRPPEIFRSMRSKVRIPGACYSKTRSRTRACNPKHERTQVPAKGAPRHQAPGADRGRSYGNRSPTCRNPHDHRRKSPQRAGRGYALYTQNCVPPINHHGRQSIMNHDCPTPPVLDHAGAAGRPGQLGSTEDRARCI